MPFSRKKANKENCLWFLSLSSLCLIRMIYSILRLARMKEKGKGGTRKKEGNCLQKGSSSHGCDSNPLAPRVVVVMMQIVTRVLRNLIPSLVLISLGIL